MGDRRFFARLEQGCNEENPFAAYHEMCYNANNLNEKRPDSWRGRGAFLDGAAGAALIYGQL